jgi:hypothetical protein
LAKHPLVVLDADFVFVGGRKRATFQQIPNVMSSFNLPKYRISLSIGIKQKSTAYLTGVRASDIVNEWIKRAAGANESLRSHGRTNLNR